MAWNHENRAQWAPESVSGGGLPTESYLYDDSAGAPWARIKKTTGSTTTYYPFAHYEQTGSTVTKYYFFNGQRHPEGTRMKRGSTVSYLHSDHLGSTVLETNTAGDVSADQRYRAYGRQRDSGPVVTDHRFTGQKLDGTGLYYDNARYYDPALGAFIGSPLGADTLVPRPGGSRTNLLDYNRYLYGLGNPLKYNDPSGHCATSQPSASDTDAYEEWSSCWTSVNTILQQWDTTPDYFNGRYGSKEWFGERIAKRSDLGADYFSNEIMRWVQSDDYAAWQQQSTEAVKNHTLPTSVVDPVNAVGVGFSYSGSIPIFGALGGSGGGGVELLAHQDGSVSLYGFGEGGASIGVGATTNLYVGKVRNLANPADYAAQGVSTDYTASLVIGGTAGTFSSSVGAYGEKYGFAPGAKFSGSISWSTYSPPLQLIGPRSR